MSKEAIYKLRTYPSGELEEFEYVQDIVRCKECKWWIDNLTENDDDEAYDSCRWDWSRKIPTADDFCNYGERRE